jgi:hypothetical protein
MAYIPGVVMSRIIDSKGMEATGTILERLWFLLTEMMAKDAGEWQSYDVTLVGRLVTLTVNGKTVICNQIIPGITGGPRQP